MGSVTHHGGHQSRGQTAVAVGVGVFRTAVLVGAGVVVSGGTAVSVAAAVLLGVDVAVGVSVWSGVGVGVGIGASRYQLVASL